MTNFDKLLKEQHTEIVNTIHEYNKALKDEKAFTVSSIEDKLKRAEAAYNETARTKIFTELKNSENPVKAAITQYQYLTVSHRTIRDDGIITGLEIVEDKPMQIDLVKFCTFCELPTVWQYKVEKFNQLLAMRAAKELKMTAAQIKKLKDTFYMNELAKREEMGETPDSNTAMCKQLQMILDAVLFEDNGKGKNKYRVNNHDIAYLLMCYSKRGRKTLSVAVAKNAYMHRLVMDIMHRVVMGKTYDIEYRMVSTNKTKNAKTSKETEKPSEKTADKDDNTVIISK